MLSLGLWCGFFLVHCIFVPPVHLGNILKTLFYCQLGSPALVNPESHVKGVNNQTLMMWGSSVVLETDQGSPLGEGLQGPHGRCLGQLFCVILSTGPRCGP